MMIETTLRRFLEHPHRRWIVTILTCFILLAVTWPAVDDYQAARTARDEIAARLAADRATIGRTSEIEDRVRQVLADAAALETWTMDEQQSERFRGEVVQLVRQSGCRMTRNSLSTPREREWYKHDNFLALRPVSEKKAERTPFLLRTRNYNVTVSGTMANVARLLAELSQKEQLIHASGFRMQKADDENTVVLELELILIELARPAPARTRA